MNNLRKSVSTLKIFPLENFRLYGISHAEFINSWYKGYNDGNLRPPRVAADQNHLYGPSVNQA